MIKVEQTKLGVATNFKGKSEEILMELVFAIVGGTIAVSEEGNEEDISANFAALVATAAQTLEGRGIKVNRKKIAEMIVIEEKLDVEKVAEELSKAVAELRDAILSAAGEKKTDAE